MQLDARDRALATELVYGTLRVAPWLDAKLAAFAPRGTSKLDAQVRARLELAAYQLFFTRVPAFAAVNEAVQAIRDVRGPRLAAFANAVLRKVAAQASGPERADADGAELRVEALLASTPPWLREALERSITPRGRAHSFDAAWSLRRSRCAWSEEPNGKRGSRAFARRRPTRRFEPGRISPLAILARGAGKPQQLPGWSEGAWSVQEEGSQLAALAVGARDGETVLDACAGRGNKTAVLARAVGETGSVDACDASPAKLERLGVELARLGLRPRATFAVDWTVGSGEVTGEYDRVLVDAPCSGVGTLRRRPEIALRRRSEDLGALAGIELAVARRAAGHVRRGGSLVYVVCSVLREEGASVMDALVEALPGFERAPFDIALPEAAPVTDAENRPLAPDASTILLLPHVHGTDGYFIARLVRR